MKKVLSSILVECRKRKKTLAWVVHINYAILNSWSSLDADTTFEAVEVYDVYYVLVNLTAFARLFREKISTNFMLQYFS